MKTIRAVLIVLLLGLSAMVPSMIAANKTPVAEAGPDKQAAPGVTVWFNGSDSSDPYGKPLNYSWDFDASDGISADATGVTVSHVYNTEGKYVATLAVSNVDGDDTDICNVTIASNWTNHAPVAVISEPANFAIHNNTAPINFSADGSYDVDGQPLTYRWDFGDNTKATGKNVKHQYKNAGIYTVVLNVTDGQLSNAASITLLIESTPGGPPIPGKPPVPSRPIVKPDGPYKGMTYEAILLDGSATKGDGGNISFCWDLDARNGIQAQYCFDQNATLKNYWDVAFGKTPTVAWKSTGNYTITLIVRQDGLYNSYHPGPVYQYGYNTTNVVITPHYSFIVDAGKDKQIVNNEKTTLNGRVTLSKYPPFGTKEGAIQCNWDFNNDSKTDYSISFDQSEWLKDVSCPAVHTYVVNGTIKNATKFVSRLQGVVAGNLWLQPTSSPTKYVQTNYTAYRNDTVNLTVPPPPNVPPVVTCGPDKTGPNAAFVGEDTRFTASATDADGDGVTSYEWDFDGDGQVDYSNPASGDTSYTYKSAGSYVSTLNVTDQRKSSTFCYVNVTVIQNRPPTAAINAPDSANAGSDVTFDGSGSSDADGTSEIVSYSWDFDASDGVTTDGTGKVVTHSYTKGGTYTVTLTVQDRHGATATMTVDIKITQTYGVKLEASGATTVSVDPGKAQIFTLKITNTGNGDDIFDLEKSGSKTTWGDLSSNSISLKGGTMKTITLKVTVPSTTVAGDSATLTVTAISKGSPDAKDSVQYKVTAQQSYGVGVHMESPSATINAGEAKTLSIRVTNLGNGKDTFKIKADGTDKAWVSFQPESLGLDPLEVKEVTITVSVPSDAKGGDHSITITAYSVGDNNQKAVVIVTITVKEKTTPKVIPGFDPAFVLLALAVAFLVIGAWKKRKRRA
jgi:PKD repeat protein